MTAFYVCVWTVFTIPQEFKKKKKSTSSSCINWSVGSGSAANIRIILDIVSVLITGILPTGIWCPLVHTLKTFLISSSFLSLFNALICRTFADRIQSKCPESSWIPAEFISLTNLTLKCFLLRIQTIWVRSNFIWSPDVLAKSCPAVGSCGRRN